MKKISAFITSLKESGNGRLAIALCALGVLLMLFGSSFQTYAGIQGARQSASLRAYEKEISALCEQVCAQEIYVSVNTSSDGSLAGIAVVCRRLDDKTRLMLTDMLSSLYGIGSNNIYIAAPTSNAPTLQS